jgi:tRNA modification GTPase
MTAETIFALASGSTRSAIAVMRLSGPLSGPAIAGLCRGRLPPPRLASFRRLRAPDGDVLDQALVLWFPGPATETGEDAAELHLHGSRPVIDAIADLLVRAGLRPAEPGEFTRRAFLNGRVDLVQAEAVHDLVFAETEAQRRQAIRQLEGALGALYQGWSDRLRTILAHQEALIDFPDEDLPVDVEAGLLATSRGVRDEIRAHLDDSGRGEKLRDGLFFAITGAPNVGKSTLINALADREVAIVSDLPGTTRDALEARVLLGGVPVTLVDTAGLRETADAIEAEGVRRALARADSADLVIHVVEAGAPAPGDLPHGALLVANKADLGRPGPQAALRISARTGLGVAELRAHLAARATAMTQAAGPPPLTRTRHRAALLAAAAHLNAAEQAELPELRAEDLRLAMREIGRITGHVGVEDLLDTIFLEFCIGK